MPPNPHYESVRAKVITACPELMELSFGCFVKIYRYHNAPVCVRDVVEWSREIRVERFGELLKKDQYIIIGHPIRLSHVLRALAQKDNGFELNNCCGDRTHLVSITCFATGESPDWNLEKDDLAQQDPSVWEVLDKMLSV